MQSLVIFGCIVVVAVAQRPSFAGLSARGYPELASRFRDTTSSDTLAPSSTDLLNRAGEITSTTTIKIPVDKTLYYEQRPVSINSKDETTLGSEYSSTDVVNRAGEISSTTTTRRPSDDSGVDAIAAGQRPSFAGLSPKGYPDVAARFKDTSPDVVNRLGEGGSTTTPKIVVATDETLERVKQWPRENQPFSVLNAQHIEQHLHPERQQKQEVQRRSAIEGDYFVNSRPIRPTQSRSSFLDPSEEDRVP